MKKSLLFFVTILLFIECSGQSNVLPTPIITGPVTGPGTIFGASAVDLKSFGYIEEEYFLEGKARRYNFDAYPGNATQVDTLYPYKTRIIVRRPVDPKKFNGTVVVEWLNVSSMYDFDSDWCQLSYHLLRSGYAWVGVSAQRDGIHSPKGLKNWNPARYGTLDVTADSALLFDQLSGDIFSEAVAAIKRSSRVSPLENLKPEVIIASGHSQSAHMLTGYYNAIHPIYRIIDGFMIRGGGHQLRTDNTAKAMRINSETDLVVLGMVATRQPDTDAIVTWEISGASHADKIFWDYYVLTGTRDLGSVEPLECSMPLCSLVPFYYAFAAALDHFDRWIRSNTPPPAGIPITVRQTSPAVALSRDSLNNVIGGIRLPQFDVPVAMNTGINFGQGFCVFYGTHKEFDQATLKALYPTHQLFMKKFKASVLQNLEAGYILKADTAAMINEAMDQAVLWK